MREALVCAVAVAAIAAGSQAAQAAPRGVVPLSPEVCREVADAFSQRLNGMTVAVGLPGSPSDVIDRISVSGTGCAFTGTKAANTMPRGYFFNTLDVPFFKGWHQVLSADADGPNGGTFGWFKGAEVVIYSMSVLVPASLCTGAQDLAACKEAHRSEAV